VKPLLATKLKNQITAIDAVLIVNLRNVSVNGVKFGCSGFIYDPRTDRTVYVNTDHNHHTNTRALYRTAQHHKDYTGGVNHFASYADVAQAAVTLLTGKA
jgi:hypothetical protein